VACASAVDWRTEPPKRGRVSGIPARLQQVRARESGHNVSVTYNSGRQFARSRKLLMRICPECGSAGRDRGRESRCKRFVAIRSSSSFSRPNAALEPRHLQNRVDRVDQSPRAAVVDGQVDQQPAVGALASTAGVDVAPTCVGQRVSRPEASTGCRSSEGREAPCLR